MHASLAISDSGVPLGLLYSKQWSRDFKNLRKEGKNFSRVLIEEKESYKWIEGVSNSYARYQSSKLVHVCDRDGDIYELFELCNSLNTSFVIHGVHSRGTWLLAKKAF